MEKRLRLRVVFCFFDVRSIGKSNGLSLFLSLSSSSYPLCCCLGLLGVDRARLGWRAGGRA